MNLGHFAPVTIDLPSDRIGLYRNVTSAQEAAELLIDKWPEMRGPKFIRALEMCLAALEGRKSANDARTAFIDAAKEAGIYVDR